MPKKSSELNSSFSVQKEIMDLKSQLSEKESELIRLECSLLSSGPESTTSNSSTSEAEEWQAKYDRLLDAHRKLQKTNNALEDKLLRIVDKFESDKNQGWEDAHIQMGTVGSDSNNPYLFSIHR